ncbi:MAG: hypothetical protein WAJ94_10415 [Candidatus Cybelea sp.]
MVIGNLRKHQRLAVASRCAERSLEGRKALIYVAGLDSGDRPGLEVARGNLVVVRFDR